MCFSPSTRGDRDVAPVDVHRPRSNGGRSWFAFFQSKETGTVPTCFSMPIYNLKRIFFFFLLHRKVSGFFTCSTWCRCPIPTLTGFWAEDSRLPYSLISIQLGLPSAPCSPLDAPFKTSATLDDATSSARIVKGKYGGRGRIYIWRANRTPISRDVQHKSSKNPSRYQIVPWNTLFRFRNTARIFGNSIQVT